MPSDKLLKEEIKKLNIKTSNTTTPFIFFVVPIIFLLSLGLFYLIKAKTKKHALFYIILMLAIIFLAIVALKSHLCNLVLSFGADKNCNSVSNYSNFDYDNIINILFSSIIFPEDCGMSKIVESYLNDKDITYMNNKVNNITRNKNNCTFTLDNNKKITFDKCIISCRYEEYKSIISLTEEEKSTLSGVEYFDFYSTLVKLPENIDKPIIKDSIDYFQLDHKVYLIASHKPITPEPNTYTFNKSYKWRMPIIKNILERQKINKHDNIVFFIGKELAGNGVNSCMKYSKKLSTFF